MPPEPPADEIMSPLRKLAEFAMLVALVAREVADAAISVLDVASPAAVVARAVRFEAKVAR